MLDDAPMAPQATAPASPVSAPAPQPNAPRSGSGSAAKLLGAVVIIVIVVALAAYFLLGNAGSSTHQQHVTTSIAASTGTANAPTLSPLKSATATAGGGLTLKAAANGGKGPYTYRYNVVNSLSGKVVASASYSSPLTSNTFTWQVPSTYAGSSIEANVVVTDSAGQTTASNYSAPVVIHANYSTASKYLVGALQLSNNQGNGTGPGFQQMVTFNALKYSPGESNSLGNIRFYMGSNELHSWCESGCSAFAPNAVFWVLVPVRHPRPGQHEHGDEHPVGRHRVRRQLRRGGAPSSPGDTQPTTTARRSSASTKTSTALP